jgi:hypothetical protein
MVSVGSAAKGACGENLHFTNFSTLKMNEECALAEWFSGHRVSLQSRRSWVRIHASI